MRIASPVYDETTAGPGVPPDGAPVVEVRNLTAGYGERTILTDVSFTVRRREILALIGGSGCGKSTVIRTLVGLLRPMSGEVRVFGQNPAALEDQERILFLRRIGMLFQNGALLGSMTVGDNVALPFREHTSLPEPVIRRIIEAKLASVGLPHAASLMPSQLSGGMRKRASLSRAMAMDPDLLLCDEPSAGLDPIVAAGIDVILRHLQRSLGMTILVVTHELSSVALIADRVVMLDDGRVLAVGTVEEMRSSDNPQVRDFFARKPPSDTTHTGRTLLEALEQDQ
jgi:phospholipid/cholesterol/gamma-HCH transport system ATP-binding protein